MTGYDSSDDYRPLFYVRGHGVYLATLLVGVHVTALVVWCLLVASGLNLDGALAFSSDLVLRRGQVWRLATYALLHRPSIGFVIEMAMLGFFFGREVERHLGRRAFGFLYGGLLLSTPLLLCAWSLVAGPQRFSDTILLHFGIFIAFAAIFPDVQIFFGVAAKWIALVLLAIWSLLDLSQQDWLSLALLWAVTGSAILGVRMAGAGGGLSFLDRFQNPFPKRTPAPRTALKPRARPRRAVEAGVGAGAGAVSGGSGGASGNVHESIDPLLEKISKHGLASLSPSERATLERARASLLRKDRNG